MSVSSFFRNYNIFKYWIQIVDLENVNIINIYDKNNEIHVWYTNRVNKLIKVLRNKYPHITNHTLKCIIIIYISYTIDESHIAYNVKHEPSFVKYKAIYKSRNKSRDNSHTYPDNSITLNITHLMFLTNIKDPHVMHSINKNYAIFSDINTDKYFTSLGYPMPRYYKQLDNIISQ